MPETVQEVQVYDTPDQIAHFTVASYLSYCKMRARGLQFSPGKYPTLGVLRKRLGIRANTFAEAAAAIEADRPRIVALVSANIRRSRGISDDSGDRVDSSSPGSSDPGTQPPTI